MHLETIDADSRRNKVSKLESEAKTKHCRIVEQMTAKTNMLQ